MNHQPTDSRITLERLTTAIALLGQPRADASAKDQAARQVIEALPELSPLWGNYTAASFPTYLFRVTKAKAISEQNTAHARSFSYPTPDKCTLGRANVGGCPVLYQSENTETALQEVSCEPGEVLYLSEWAFEQPTGARFAFFLHDRLDRGHPWLALKAQYLRPNSGDGNLAVTDWVEQLHALYCQAFRSDDYGVSSLIAHHLLYGPVGPRVDVLVYPSQAGDHNHCNLAIATSFADAHVRLMRVFKIKKGAEDGEPTQMLALGEAQGDLVHWHELSVGHPV